AKLAVHRVTGRRMQRAPAPRGSRAQSGSDRLTHDPIHAEKKKIVGISSIGTDADAYRTRAQRRHSLDRLRQRIPRRLGISAAQKNPDTVLEEVVGDLTIDGFMRIAD